MRRTSGETKPPSALWVCPKCRAKLVARNLSHACGDFSVERFLSDKSARGRGLFERFVAMISACGSYDVAPAKTRIAFMSKVRFASVNRVGDDAIDVHFVLPRAVESARFRRVEKVDNVYVHHLRLRDPADFDDELARWLEASYVEYGARAWLAGRERTSANAKSGSGRNPAR